MTESEFNLFLKKNELEVKIEKAWEWRNQKAWVMKVYHHGKLVADWNEQYKPYLNIEWALEYIKDLGLDLIYKPWETLAVKEVV